MNKDNFQSKIIIALDFSSQKETLAFIRNLSPEKCRLKIGKSLFTREGPQLVKTLQDLGFDIFLDLKFHDIPNTVNEALLAAADLGVWMVNVHASGGRIMLESASETYAKLRSPPLLIAVTVLTSMSNAIYQEMHEGCDVDEQVLKLTNIAYQTGINGVVCSAHEAKAVKALTRDTFLTVTPGIRLDDSVKIDDQTRIMTPKRAIANGSDFLVIGRPITRAEWPIQVLDAINCEIN